ncbi:MAG: hypothetical protein ACRDRP_02985 [Pseudonocardiaceae bacterium]
MEAAFPLIEQVNDPQEPVETVSKADTAYLVSADSGAPWRQPISRGRPTNTERLPAASPTPKQTAPESRN